MSKIEELQLETEIDHFHVIEYLGGILHFDARLIARGDLTVNGDEAKRLQRLASLQQRATDSLREKFNIVIPGDPGYPTSLSLLDPQRFPAPPQGKRWYAVWYRDIKRVIYGAEYEQLICSSCPYSLGEDVYVQYSARYPCSLMTGGHGKVRWPSHCGMIKPDELWDPTYRFNNNLPMHGKHLSKDKREYPGYEADRDDFFAKMEQEHGPHAVLTFRRREQVLRRRCEAGLLKVLQ